MTIGILYIFYLYMCFHHWKPIWSVCHMLVPIGDSPSCLVYLSNKALFWFCFRIFKVISAIKFEIKLSNLNNKYKQQHVFITWTAKMVFITCSAKKFCFLISVLRMCLVRYKIHLFTTCLARSVNAG